MKKERLYSLLKVVKYKLTKQQYLTLKGQIKANDLDGAFMGLMKILNVR